MNENQQNGQEVKQNLTQEELAKTQVLNLTELQEVAKFERKTSKRPALLLAIAGLLSITVGLSYTSLMSAIDSMPPKKYEYRYKDDTVETTDPERMVSCGAVSSANQDGTSGSVTFNLIFDTEDKLQELVTEVSFQQQSNNAIGLAAIQNYYTLFKQAEALPLPGYSVSTKYSETGVSVTTTVDLTSFDPTSLTSTHQLTPFTMVPYKLGDDKTTIVNTLNAAGYTCK